MKKALRELLVHIGRHGLIRGIRIVLLKSRRASGPRAIASPLTGGRILVRPGTSDMAIYDQIVLQPYLPRDRERQVIVDCGSNIGITVRYLKAAHPAARIIAIEPDAGNFALLERNCAGLPGITCVQAGIWPTEGRLLIERDGLSPSGFRTHLTNGAEGIAALSIPAILDRFGLGRISLLKIDIEGSELELFSAPDLSWLERVDAIAIELHDEWRPGCGDAFFKAIAPWRWTYRVVGEMILCERMGTSS